MTVDLAQLIPFLVALCTLIALLGAGLRWIRRWIQEAAAPAHAAARQVRTSNGKTLAEYTESSARDLMVLKAHITDLARETQENRDRSVRAETLAASAHERLDKHLINDHGVHVTPTHHEEKPNVQ